MIQLKKPLHRFSPENFGKIADLLDIQKASPRDTLVIACSDHGTAPDNISFAGSDRLFILQHLAGSIPAPEECVDGVTIDDVKFSFNSNQFKHVIICGHLGCNVIPAWLKDTDIPDHGRFRQRFLRTTQAAVDKSYSNVSVAARLELMIYEHVLFQLENLQKHDFIRHQLESGTVHLFGWVADESTARVHNYDPRAHTFQLI